MSAYSAETRTRWLGNVPPEWNVAPAWAVFHERSEKSGPTDDRLTPSQHYGVLTQREYMELTGNRVVVNKSDSDVAKRVRPNDFIIHLRSFQGGIEHSRVSGKVTNAYTVLRPVAGVDPEYYRHFLKSDPLISGLSSMTDQLRDGQSINFGKFSTMRLPLPPLPTQRAIAGYLDRETAEIDAMAAELEELVVSLETRRGSVVRITLAELTDKARAGESSDHKWAKLGTLVQTISGIGFPPKLQGNADQELPFYKVGSLSMVDSDGAINDERNTVSHATAQTLGARIIPSGSLLMAKVGAALFLSRFVPTRVDSCTLLVNSRFLTYALSMVPVNLLANPGPIPSLNVQGLKDERLPLPTLDEQRRIVEHLDEVTADIDSMISDAQELKALLAERRSALISEVVTGRKEVPVS